MTEVHHCLLCGSVYFTIHRSINHLGFRCLGCKRLTWHRLHSENRLLLGNEQRVGGYASRRFCEAVYDAIADVEPLTEELREILEPLRSA